MKACMHGDGSGCRLQSSSTVCHQTHMHDHNLCKSTTCRLTETTMSLHALNKNEITPPKTVHFDSLLLQIVWILNNNETPSEHYCSSCVDTTKHLCLARRPVGKSSLRWLVGPKPVWPPQTGICYWSKTVNQQQEETNLFGLQRSIYSIRTNLHIIHTIYYGNTVKMFIIIIIQHLCFSLTCLNIFVIYTQM